MRKKIEKKSISRARKTKKSSKRKTERIKRVFVAKLKDNATPSEILFARLLEKNNIKFEFQRPIQCGSSFYIVDFWLHEYNCVVEIDGGYHLTPIQEKKDLERTRRLLKKKRIRKVVRFQNEELCDESSLLRKLSIEVCPFSKVLISQA